MSDNGKAKSAKAKKAAAAKAKSKPPGGDQGSDKGSKPPDDESSVFLFLLGFL